MRVAMSEHHDPDAEALPLRDRMQEYLTLFGMGIAAAAAAGVFFSLVTASTFASAFGYSLVGLAVALLLGGGLAGSGLKDLGAGAVGAMLGSSARSAGSPDRPSPRERLRAGLRPEANPRAFWQVIGGFAYFALGAWIVLQFAS